MDDVIGRVFAYILIGFGFFILAPVLLLLNSDLSSRSYLNTAVNEFVEEARMSGVLRKSDYDQMITKIGATGQTYVVRLEHKSQTAVPANSGDGYEISYLSYNLGDVFAVWDGNTEERGLEIGTEGEKSDYVMKSGDYLSISLVSQNSTLGSRLYGALTGQPQGVKLTASAGGIVGR